VQFLFADYSLDTDRRELLRGPVPVAVEPQVFDLLIYLVRNRDRVVSKHDLIASVWGGRTVSDSTLASRINAARKAIGDSGEQQRLIRTLQRKGVRFVADVRTNAQEGAPAQATALPDAQAQTRPSDVAPFSRPAIAVLPFANMSGEPEQEYFSDGISEDIITALSKLRWFFVVARNSSFTYKDKPVHVKQIAQGPAVISGRNATTARWPTYSRCRTRSPTRSSPRSSPSYMRRKTFAPGASLPRASTPGAW
jgi:DNA-binding winged helix-turn-helix (wHTH) protein